MSATKIWFAAAAAALFALPALAQVQQPSLAPRALPGSVPAVQARRNPLAMPPGVVPQPPAAVMIPEAKGPLPAAPVPDAGTLDALSKIRAETSLLRAKLDEAKARKELNDVVNKTEPEDGRAAAAAPSAGYDPDQPGVVVRSIRGRAGHLLAELAMADGSVLMAEVGTVTPTGWRVTKIDVEGTSEVELVNERNGRKAEVGVGGGTADAAYANAAVPGGTPPSPIFMLPRQAVPRGTAPQQRR